ncbi:MAG: MASE1 domain-containing protein [Prosthecobacter sp.]|uniref:sensor histidine kinase n=1 Tax=Prosthecobacter sp. TaxID=1965333 RepID=UPI0019ECF9D2|nr:MASE1 domain-containing protein [Prosthecobacter sp.]MBE2286334.1 MASE1 domain-containing protein [Prosthecobacter sp.]
MMENDSTAKNTSRWRLPVGTVMLALLYYAGARVGLLMAIDPTNASPVWPPAGVALAGLLLFGWKAWPGVWLAAFWANFAVFSRNEVAADGTLVTISAVIATGNALEALAGWWLCRLRAKFDDDGTLRSGDRLLFGRGMGVFWFATVALLAPAVSAAIGPAAVCAAGIAPWSEHQRLLLTWWSGDATGMLYLVPFLFCLTRRKRLSWQASGRLFQLISPEKQWKSRWWDRTQVLHGIETVMAFLFLAAACWVVMSGMVIGRSAMPEQTAQVLKFIMIAPLMWIAIRVGLRGTAFGLVILGVFFVWHAHEQFGELDVASEFNSTLIWLAFLWVTGVSSLTLANFVAAHKDGTASLRETNAALQATMDAIPAMVCVSHDPDCHHITGNGPAHELLRVPPGRNLSKTPPPDAPQLAFDVRINGQDLPLTELAMQKASATGRAVIGQEQQLTFANGDVRFIYGNAVPVLDEKGQSRGCVAAFIDSTELRRAKDDLAAMNERLEERVTERTERLVAANTELAREYADRQRLEDEMTQISERERLTLGQNLHDGVCQHLSGVAFMASTLAADVRAKGLDEEAEKLDDLTQLIREATQQARDVARGLHPVELDAEGLVAALRHLAASSSVDTLRCSLHCPHSVPVRDNAAAMHLYRIAQEAVVNATKHASAAEIIISLDVNDENIVLSVADDGSGLPAEQFRSHGLGLRMMRHRAAVIGARLTIESPPEGGTMVTCVLPLIATA